MIWTPNDLTVLIYFHCAPGTAHPNRGMPAVQGAIDKWVSQGVLEVDVSGAADAPPTYQVVPGRGTKMVDMLLDTPLPELRWVDPR